MTVSMKIGELARRVGCQVETIRYYEHEGLLPALDRSIGNYRLYGQVHVKRLLLIRQCRSLDMTLDEIRTLLRVHDSPQASCKGANELLDRHIGHVAARIADLRLLAKQLKDLRGQCAEASAARDCGILKRLGEAKSGPPVSSRRDNGHISGTHSRRAGR